MKIVFAGLLSGILCAGLTGCAHLNNNEKETFEIKLQDLASDKRFKEIKKDQYQVTFDDESLVKVVKYRFENQKDLQTYLLNRRMILHQDFQNNIAPYLGLLNSDKSCAQMVNLKGDIKKLPNGEHFSLEMPITNERVVSECVRNDVWGLMTYEFYNCFAKNELFEIRYSRSLSAGGFEFQAQCE